MTIWSPDLDSRAGPRYLALADAIATMSRPAFCPRAAACRRSAIWPTGWA